MDIIPAKALIKNILMIMESIDSTEEKTDYLTGYYAAFKGAHNLVSYNLVKGVKELPIGEIFITLTVCPNPYIDPKNTDTYELDTARGWQDGISDIEALVESLSVLVSNPKKFGYIV